MQLIWCCCRNAAKYSVIDELSINAEIEYNEIKIMPNVFYLHFYAGMCGISIDVQSTIDKLLTMIWKKGQTNKMLFVFFLLFVQMAFTYSGCLMHEHKSCIRQQYWWVKQLPLLSSSLTGEAPWDTLFESDSCLLPGTFQHVALPEVPTGAEDAHCTSVYQRK